MDSLSGRPPTPTASSAAASLPQASGSKIHERLRSYSPTLFDILNISDLIKAAKGSNSSHIPPTFLETASVDSAKQIGSGASFRASLRAIPESTEEIQIQPIDMGTWTVTTTLPAPSRPKYVVFKVAKVAFDKRGNPHQDHKIALQSVLTEFHALLHPSLLKHPNVVDLLDIAWGSNPFSPEQRLPSLVLEYADQGTLLDAVRRGDMSSAEKRVLCHDTAAGLQALHDAGLIHGDVKAENVLLFSGKDRRVAKLGDFGFSLVEGFESDTVWLGGTRPWQAPEVQHAVPITEAKHSDTYSFGLLVWYLALDGCDPFKRLFVSTRPIEEWDQDMANFKAQDGLRHASKTTVWFPLHLEKIMQEGKITANPKINRVLGEISGKARDRLPSLVKQACALIIHGDEILQVIDRVFEHSLVSEPMERSLPAIIDILQPVTTSIPLSELTLQAASTSVVDEEGLERGSDPAWKENAKGAKVDEVPNGGKASQPSLQSWGQRGFKTEILSWHFIRTLPPALHRTVFKALSETEENSDDASKLLILCSCLVNGYGCDVDFERALKVLRRAAKLGSVPARANLYRIHAALGREEVAGEDLTVHLDWYACSGSIAALVDHASLASQGPKSVKGSVAHASGGVGAWWTHGNQMLHGLTQTDWSRDGFLLSQAETLPNIREYKINMRGDTLAHFAAACGDYKSLKALIGRFGFDVNCRNDAGDTPLICASRSGQGGTMILLIQDFGADPSLAANNGETALHWLISFNDATARPVARDLLARGADLEAMTKERVVHHTVPWVADVETLKPGTAIGWAARRNRPEIVRVLLDAGALVYHDNDFNEAGPLNWAAQFHHTQCLKLMIDALECRHKRAAQETGGNVASVWYSSPLHLATHSADIFSMILRNGTNYLQDMTETLDLLRQKSTGMRSLPNFGGKNQTLFYLAVAEAHDEVVHYMLRHRWHIEDLDRPCGESLRTPVLEAVRWGRMSIVNLLIEHGADIHARGANPYKPKEKNWSALHVIAMEGREEGSMVENIISHGLDVDGQEMLLPAPVKEERSEEVGSHPRNDRDGASEYLVETPLSCALRNNAFSLCDTLITCGADPYAICTSAGLYSVSTPTTILGHTIISNSLYSLPRLRYLFRQEPSTLVSAKTLLFNVQPSLELSALHLAALVPSGVRTTDGTIVKTSDFDFDTNREILHELLSHFKAPEYLQARCLPDGNTALMIAVQQKNLGAVEELLIAGADREITNFEDKTALDLVVEQMEVSGMEGWEEVLELFEQF